MWEDATPKPAPDQPDQTPGSGQPARSQPAGGNFVLWAQIVLVSLALAGMFAARQLRLPAYDGLRHAVSQALEQPGLAVFDGDRSLVRFVQTGLSDLEQAAAEAAVELTGALSTAETARPAHGKSLPEAPAGSSSEAYLPDFTLIQPLPVGFTTSSGYGWRSDPLAQQETPEFHRGRDLAAAEGTPVYAAADGTVRSTVKSDSYGNCLRLLHANGDETLYAHMQYIFVHPGQRVRQGQVIGTVGQTGNVTGPHLHFELLHNGIRYDPSRALGLA